MFKPFKMEVNSLQDEQTFSNDKHCSNEMDKRNINELNASLLNVFIHSINNNHQIDSSTFHDIAHKIFMNLYG